MDKQGAGKVAAGNSFGGFFKARRMATGLTLRAFCLRHKLDPGNLSRIERGRMPPPQSEEVLRRYAKYLSLKEGGDDWYTFFDLAAAERGKLPRDLSDAEVLVKLPVLFRSLRGEKVSIRQMRKLAEEIRRT